MAPLKHIYRGMKFESILETDGTFKISLGGRYLKGSRSPSRGQSNCFAKAFIDNLLDPDRPIPRAGDFIRINGIDYVIDSLDFTGDGNKIHILKGSGSPFFGPDNAMQEDQSDYISISGGPFETIPKPKKLKHIGTGKLRCWQWLSLPCADGGFQYVRKVNIWESDE